MSTSGSTTAGVTLPDTKLARDATEFVRDSTTELVFHHNVGGLAIVCTLKRNSFHMRSGDGPATGVASTMIWSIRRITSSSRSSSAAASASSTWFGSRVPTMATWTATLANVHATAI